MHPGSWDVSISSQKFPSTPSQSAQGCDKRPLFMQPHLSSGTGLLVMPNLPQDTRHSLEPVLSRHPPRFPGSFSFLTDVPHSFLVPTQRPGSPLADLPPIIKEPTFRVPVTRALHPVGGSRCICDGGTEEGLDSRPSQEKESKTKHVLREHGDGHTRHSTQHVQRPSGEHACGCWSGLNGVPEFTSP